MGRTFSLRQGRAGAASPGAAPAPGTAATATTTSAAAATVGGVPPVVADRGAWLALATGSLAFVLGTINVTVTNVAFTDILASFPGASPSLTGWILTGYALSFATMMLRA